MDSPGHGCGRWRHEARYRGGSPGVNTPSATGGERCQSRFVLGLLRLGERLPALAWGTWQGASERAWGKGDPQREVSMGQGQGECNMGRGTKGSSGRAIELGPGPGPGIGLGVGPRTGL